MFAVALCLPRRIVRRYVRGPCRLEYRDERRIVLPPRECPATNTECCGDRRVRERVLAAEQRRPLELRRRRWPAALAGFRHGIPLSPTRAAPARLAGLAAPFRHSSPLRTPRIA